MRKMRKGRGGNRREELRRGDGKSGEEQIRGQKKKE
jgi:hypothetical protein